jgi:hypothetical protein
MLLCPAQFYGCKATQHPTWRIKKKGGIINGDQVVGRQFIINEEIRRFADWA